MREPLFPHSQGSATLRGMSTLTALRRPAPAPHSADHSPAASAVDHALLAALSARFASTAADYDQSGAFPHENLQVLQQHGLIGLVVPRQYGGGGASLATARSVVAAVARGEPATALILTMTYLQHYAITRADNRWPQHLRARVAADAVRDGALINTLRVEPVLGSPARGGLPATVARRTADGWRINGHKLYSTGIEGLTWLSVWARTDEAEPRVGVFLVPRNTPGIEVIASWDHLGLRASGSHEVVFEDVAIPSEHAVDLRTPADWVPDAGSQTDIDAHAVQQAWMVVLLGSLYDAVAWGAHDWLIGFLQGRVPGSLGAPLASLPRVREHVGEIEALLRTNRVLLEDATRAVDEGRAPPAIDSGLIKHTVTNNAIRAVEVALQLTGNHGLTRHNPLQRHLRDVLCSRVHTPQNDSILTAAGKRALG
jgi:alkylation response protein AidB-like acyl-CoA dehydrogenase